jgi:hypothetical protein
MIKRILAAAAVLATALGTLTALPASATEVHGARIIPPGEWRRTADNNYVVRNDDFGTSTTAESDGEYSFSVTRGESWSGWSAFPYIGRGCSWGVCATPGGGDWPVQVGKAGYANPYVSLITTQTYRGRYNTSLDIWFNQDNSYGRSHLRTGAANGTEMMIWTNHPNLCENGIPPCGDSWPSTWIEGKEYYVMSWTANTAGVYRNYLAYVAVKQTSSLHAHLNPFFWNAESRGLLGSNWYWTSIDAGFELDGGGSGAGLGINHFSVNA